MSESKVAPIAAKLRASVLQQAVQGKLVPQDSADTPVHELLEKIHAASNGLYYEYRVKGDATRIEDIPFDIPSNWAWARMSSLCAFGSCINIEFSDVALGTWNLDLEDLEKNTGHILQKKRKAEGDKGSTKHVFKNGMVLYSKLRPYLNKVTIADEDGVCTSEILPLSFSYLTPEFAVRFFMSPYFLDFANKHTSGIKMPRLRVADTKQMLVPVPPLAEQQRIVERINEIMPLIDRLEKLERESDAVDSCFWRNLPSSILQQAVEGKLVPQDPDDEPSSVLLERIRKERAELVKQKKAKAPKGGESRIYRGRDGSWYERRGKADPVCIDKEIPFDIPNNWVWSRLIDCSEAIVDCPHSTPKYLNEDTGYYAIDTNCMDYGWNQTGSRNLSKDEYEARTAKLTPQPNDIVLSREASIGRAVILSGENYCLGQRVMLIRSGDNLDSRYLQLLFTSPYAWDLYRAMNQGTGVKHINVSAIRNMLVPVPPLAEQRRIATKVFEIRAMLANRFIASAD